MKQIIRRGFAIATALTVVALSSLSLAEEITSENNSRLKKALAKFPEADADQDGILTLSEARAFLKTNRGKITRNKDTNKRASKAKAPTHENVKYGPYDRNVFDIWLAKSDKPTPVIVFIHGGGFVGGSKNQARGSANLKKSLAAGVSFAAIQYRFRYLEGKGTDDSQRAPIQDILRDSARAIQYMRSKAKEWNLDKTRFAAYGGSAGAGTSIWLAFHDDLADPNSKEPVLRESSRLSAAGMLNGQFTYDFTQWDKELGGKIRETHGTELYKFYGLSSPEKVFSPEGKKWRADVDMRGLISTDDPPVFLYCSNADVPPKTRGIYNHHPKHAILIHQRCEAKNVESLMLIPKVRKEDARPHGDAMMRFFFKHLGVQQD